MKLHPTISLICTLLLTSSHAETYNADATAPTTAAPVVTTQYLEVAIGSTVTYKEFIVTQTFAAVPDQWPEPGVGTIGYGTLTKTGKNKREEAEPTVAGIAGRIPSP